MYITIRSIVFKLIALIAMFALVHKQSDYVIYGSITIFASSASNTLNFINIRRFVNLNFTSKYNFKQHLKPIVVFFAMSCATTIYTNLDAVMLGFMMKDADVGYYNAAVKIKSVLVSIVTSLGVVLLPRASYYLERGLKEQFLNITQKAINFVILFAMPLMLYFFLFAREGILFLSDTSYEDSILPMQIMIPTILFIGLTNVMGIQMLIPMGREKVVLYSEISGAIVNLVLNFALIPILASIGTAIGTLAAEVVVWIVQYIALRDVVIAAYKKIRYIALLFALIIGFVASIWIKLLPIKNSLILLFSSGLFFGMYGLTLTLTKEPLTTEIEKQIYENIHSIIKKRRTIK